MSDVLRGQYGLTIEQQLNLLADAIRVEMPSQLSYLRAAPGHHVIAAAMIDDRPQLYSIRCELHRGKEEPAFEYTRYIRKKNGTPPWFLVTGSGAGHLFGNSGRSLGKEWMRQTIHMIERVEERRMSPWTVADRFAALNHRISTSDSLVGPQCIVIWRSDGGAAQFYNGLHRVEPDVVVPSVSCGIDTRALASALMSVQPRLDEWIPGKPIELDAEEQIRAGQACLENQDSRPKRRL